MSMHLLMKILKGHYQMYVAQYKVRLALAIMRRPHLWRYSDISNVKYHMV